MIRYPYYPLIAACAAFFMPIAKDLFASGDPITELRAMTQSLEQLTLPQSAKPAQSNRVNKSSSRSQLMNSFVLVHSENSDEENIQDSPEEQMPSNTNNNNNNNDSSWWNWRSYFTFNNSSRENTNANRSPLETDIPLPTAFIQEEATNTAWPLNPFAALYNLLGMGTVPATNHTHPASNENYESLEEFKNEENETDNESDLSQFLKNERYLQDCFRHINSTFGPYIEELSQLLHAYLRTVTEQLSDENANTPSNRQEILTRSLSSFQSYNAFVSLSNAIERLIEDFSQPNAIENYQRAREIALKVYTIMLMKGKEGIAQNYEAVDALNQFISKYPESLKPWIELQEKSPLTHEELSDEIDRENPDIDEETLFKAPEDINASADTTLDHEELNSEIGKNLDEEDLYYNYLSESMEISEEFYKEFTRHTTKTEKNKKQTQAKNAKRRAAKRARQELTIKNRQKDRIE